MQEHLRTSEAVTSRRGICIDSPVADRGMVAYRSHSRRRRSSAFRGGTSYSIQKHAHTDVLLRRLLQFDQDPNATSATNGVSSEQKVTLTGRVSGGQRKVGPVLIAADGGPDRWYICIILVTFTSPTRPGRHIMRHTNHTHTDV